MSILAHEIYQKLAARDAEETEDVATLTKLLQEAINAIVQGLRGFSGAIFAGLNI